MEPLHNIEHRIEIPAPAARVWEALTRPEQVTKWLGCRNFAPEIGHEFHFQPDVAKRHETHAEGVTHCEVLALEPESRLAFSWYVPERPITQVTLSLEALDAGRTVVRLVHSGWEQFPPQAADALWRQLERGWSAVLTQLRDLVEADGAAR